MIMKRILLLSLLLLSINCHAQRIEDTVYHQINLNLEVYKQQQMTGLALQLFAVATFYGMQSAKSQQQHDIAFVFGAVSMYFGTIIRINSFDKLYFKR